MMRKLWPALLVCMAVSTTAMAGTAFWAPLPGNTAGHARLIGAGVDTNVSVDPTLVDRPFTADWAAKNPTSGLIDAGNGRYNVVGNAGRHKGVLTNDAGDWLKIDDTQAYTFYASWDLPPSPETSSVPDPGTGNISVLNARMFVGPNTGWTYFTNGGGLQFNAGLEWVIDSNQWMIDSDTSGNLGNKTMLETAPQHFEIFYTFTPPGTYVVEYSLDYGPRMAMVGSPLVLNPSDAAWAPYLTPQDTIQTSYRGDAARNFYAYATGDGVPTVGNGGAGDADGDGVNDLNDAYPLDPNLAGDSDGDGIDDFQDEFPSDPTRAGDHDGDGVDSVDDPWPFNPNYSTDSDSDGLADEWEDLYWPGDLSQGPNGDPDHDGFTNAEEFENGTNPLVADRTLPVAGIVGLVGLGLALAAGGARVMRKR